MENTVRKWFQNQDNYSLQKPVRQTFKKARVVVSGIDDQFDADLADVSKISHENDGVKYLLVVIDIFSKYLWIQPLKNKRAKDVVNGFKLIFDQGRKCKKLKTDNDSEFISKVTRAYLKQEGIYYFTTQNSNTKANIAECLIHTIRNMMYRYFTKNRTHRYIDVLVDIVKGYNATPHKSLNNVAPKDVSKNNEADTWAHMYLKPKQSKKNVTPYHFKTGNIIDMEITGKHDMEYVDLKRSKVYVKAKIAKGNRSKLETMDYVGPVNLFLQSMFYQV